MLAHAIALGARNQKSQKDLEIETTNYLRSKTMFQPAKLDLNQILRRFRDSNSIAHAPEGKASLNFGRAVSLGVLLAILFMAVGATLAFGVPTVYKKGTTVKAPGIQPGYVIANLPDGQTYAIDVQGNFAKTWASPIAGTTLGYTRPLDNKNLLAFITKTGTNQAAEFTQAGAVVWQYTETGDRTYHHDLTRLPNGNTLIVCSRQVTYLNISDKVLTDDCLLEVDTNGNTVFTWQTADHFDEFGFTDSDKVLISNGAGDWAHMNSAEIVPANANSGDSRFKPGNIIVSYRYLNMVIIVDPSTGSIVWKADNITIGQHDAIMIKNGLPGAGNIMIFDNGQNNVANHPGVVPGRLNSRIVELNPLDLSIVSSYDASKSGVPIWMFLGSFVGSSQKLPNGNILINEGPDGRIFEVTAAGALVWEWVNGVANAVTKSTLVYRAEKVALNWLQP